MGATYQRGDVLLVTRIGHWLRGCCLAGLLFQNCQSGQLRAADPPAPNSAEAKPAAVRLPRDRLLVYRGPQNETLPVRTVEDWLQRRAEILRGLQAIQGKLPGNEKRCSLDLRIDDEVDCGSYVRRLVSYAAEPGSRVPAYLLVPKAALTGGQPAPAVLCLHGTDNVVGHGVVVGLGGKPNRQYASELAERGYVCLAPNYPLLAKYQPHLQELGWDCGTLKAVWDNVRGLDLLESLPFVKPGKFGAIAIRSADTTRSTRPFGTTGSKRWCRVAAWIRSWTTTAAANRCGAPVKAGRNSATCRVWPTTTSGSTRSRLTSTN